MRKVLSTSAIAGSSVAFLVSCTLLWAGVQAVDPAGAKQLLAAAGHPGGIKIPVETTVSNRSAVPVGPSWWTPSAFVIDPSGFRRWRKPWMNRASGWAAMNSA